MIDTRTKQIVSRLADETGRQVHSEKLMEIDFVDGKPVRCGNQFGVGGRR